MLDPRGSASPAAGEEPGASAVRAVVGETTRRLVATGIDEARREAWLLLAAATGRSRADLAARGDTLLDDAALERLGALLARRLAREPMAYILGEKEFWSLPFKVAPGVLVPRPETETLVEAVLDGLADRSAPLRVLDLGTGSGCLLLALLSELPGASGVGVDASEAALEVAGENAARLRLDARCSLVRGDWGRGLRERFDLIVANPPYVPESQWRSLAPEIRGFEPKTALAAGEDGLAAYRALAPQIARLLAPGGTACLELGAGQAEAAGAVMRAAGLRVAALRRDLAGIERCLVLRR